MQKLTYNQNTVDAFRLSYRDAQGALKVTGVIDAKNVNGVPLSLGDMETAIENAIVALDTSFVGNVTVDNGAVNLTTGDRSFRITFDDDVLDGAPFDGNVPQLGFAGEFPLDFGASLGDFVGVTTSGSFGLAAILDTGLTFGIDLSPDTLIRIVPPVFTPDPPLANPGVLSGDAEFQLTLATSAAPSISVNGGSVQVVQIHNATGGTFTLTFDGQTTGDINYGAAASVVQTELAALSSITALSLEVSVIKTGDTYTIAFFKQDPQNTSKTSGIEAETTIAVNPNDPDNIIVAAVDFTGNFGTPSQRLCLRDDECQRCHSDLDAHGHSGPGVGADRCRTVRTGRTATRPSCSAATAAGSVYVHMVDKDPGHTRNPRPAARHGVGRIASTAARPGMSRTHGVIGSFAVDEDGDGSNDDNDKEFLAVGPDVNDPSQDRFAVAWHRNNAIYVSTSTDGILWSTPVRIGNATSADGRQRTTSPAAARSTRSRPSGRTARSMWSGRISGPTGVVQDHVRRVVRRWRRPGTSAPIRIIRRC